MDEPKRRTSPAELVAMPTGVLGIVLARLGFADGMTPAEVAELAGWVLFAASSLRTAWPKILDAIRALSRALRGAPPG